MRNRLYTFGVGALFAVLLLPGTAFADSGQKKIEQFRVMLITQGEADTANVAAKDRAMTEKWLKEAEVLLANGKVDAATRRLRRVEFALDLIRAMVTSSNYRILAEEQEAASYAAPDQIAALEQSIKELQKRKVELERRLRTGR